MISDFSHEIDQISLNSNADFFAPDRKPLADALGRTTHLAIGAHSDDLEIMAYHGIVECYGSRDSWFSGVTCTDGAGSSRVGPYAKYSNLEMIEVRKEEQRQAAMVGKYGAMIQLCLPSNSIMEVRGSEFLKADLIRTLKIAKPEYIYTHNPADKHETHIAVLQAVIRALHEIPREERRRKSTAARCGATWTGCQTRTRWCST